MTADEALDIARHFFGRRVGRAGESVRVVDLDEELVRIEQRTGERCPESFRHVVAGKFAVHFEGGANAGPSFTVHVTKVNGATVRIWPR